MSSASATGPSIDFLMYGSPARLLSISGRTARIVAGHSPYVSRRGAVYGRAEHKPTAALASPESRRQHGLRDPSELVITARLVGAYTIVHCALFVLFGWAVAGLFALADRDRHVLFAVFMLFLCFEVAAFALVTVLASWLLHTITPAAIIGANLIATVVMLFLLFRNHRRAPGEVLTSAE